MYEMIFFILVLFIIENILLTLTKEIVFNLYNYVLLYKNKYTQYIRVGNIYIANGKISRS